MRGMITCLARLFLFPACFCINLQSRAQCPAGLELGTESIVVNGDFSAGNTGFVSDHGYCSTPGCLTSEGKYTVADDPSVYQPTFIGSDHTTGTGNFLIVNGATSSDPAVWCQTIPVDPNSFYQISYWVSSMVGQSPASIQLTLNTFPFFGPTSAPGNVNQWNNFSQTWVSGLNTSVTMCLVNKNDNANGNDFGIDDISMIKCECALVIDAGEGDSVCYGDSVQLMGAGASSYYWTPTSSVSCITCQNPVASPEETTTYTVTASGPGGCRAIDSVTVVIYPPFDLHAGPDTSLCYGESVQLTADGAVSYQWIPETWLSDPFIATPVCTPETSINYYLNAVDQFGCNQFDSLKIKVWPNNGPVIAGNDTTVCKGDAVVLTVNQLTGVIWSPEDFLSCVECSQPLCFPDTSIVYTVSVTDVNNCFLGTDTVVITVDDSCNVIIIPTMDMPSAFSPNNDGQNDIFKVLGNGIEEVNLVIYNRWGQMVFRTTNKDIGWDGTYEGDDQEIGVYIWQLKGSLIDGTQINKRGNVTLVR